MTLINDAARKESKTTSYLKYCKTDKGKEARRRALQKYYQKNKEKIIKKNMTYYKDKYSKVIKQKRGTGKKKGANYKMVDGKKVIGDKVWNKPIYTPKFKSNIKKEEEVIEDKKFLVLDTKTKKHFSLTSEEYGEQRKQNNNLNIMVSFD